MSSLPCTTTTAAAATHNRNDDETEDLLVPALNDASRQSTTPVAIFNLIATIVGGGVLSLPLAFAKLGIGLATVLMMVAAVSTHLSLYPLCLAARYTGATSYGEIGRVALGPAMETAMAVLLFIFLLFVITAYQVLLRDIWTPLVVGVIEDFDAQDLTTTQNGNLVLLLIVILLSPFVVQHNLHALRYNCFVGFASISVLCAALCRHAFFMENEYQEEDIHADNNSNNLLYFTDNWSHILFAFPIIMLSFLCHFNVLPIQSALVRPTRARMRTVLHGAVGGSGLLMYVFGLAGYVYAGNATEGNILLNLVKEPDNDVFFTVGRWGVGITSTCGLGRII